MKNEFTSSISFRLLWLPLLLLLIAGGVVIKYNIDSISQNYLDGIYSTVQTISRVTASGISPALTFDNPEYGNLHLESMSETPEIAQVLLLDTLGKEVSHYFRDGARVSEIENHLLTKSREMTDHYFIFTTPVVSEGKTMGWLELTYSLGHFNEKIQSSIQSNTTFFIIGIVLLGFFLYLSQRAVSVPLKKLTLFIKRLNFETFDQRLEPEGKGEVWELIDAYNKSLDRLKESNISKKNAEVVAKTKTDFLSTMSHEIRTPLNSVIGVTHLLMQNNPREDQLELIKALKFSGTNLVSLINDILDFSKMEAGKLELETVVFNVEEVVDNLGLILEFEAEKKGIKFFRNIGKDVPQYLKGDPTRITQILNNLLSNALKFTDKGSVSLNMNLVEKSGDIATISFEVKDTGIGIPPDRLQKIFDSFSQAEQSTTRKFGGTGLGLAIVKNLIALHHSEIVVTSTPGMGSSFKFTLDMQIVEGEELGKFENGNSFNSLSGTRILLVDDNDMNIMIAEQFLKNWDIEVVSCTNGEQAVEKALNESFDLILMDIHMPIMDGYEATENIRAQGQEPYLSIPIIALSASISGGTREKMMEHKMTDFVPKPFDPQQLYDTIVRHLKLQETSK